MLLKTPKIIQYLSIHSQEAQVLQIFKPQIATRCFNCSIAFLYCSTNPTGIFFVEKIHFLYSWLADDEGNSSVQNALYVGFVGGIRVEKAKNTTLWTIQLSPNVRIKVEREKSPLRSSQIIQIGKNTTKNIEIKHSTTSGILKVVFYCSDAPPVFPK